MWRLASLELRGQWRLTALISFGLVLAALAYVSLVGTASGTTTVLARRCTSISLTRGT